MIAAVRRQTHTVKGILLFLGSLLALSLMDVVAKGLLERNEPFVVVWARYCSQIFWATLVLSPWLRTFVRTRYIGLQLLRSILLFTATCCFFVALSQLRLADATAVFQLAPLFITMLAYFILREKVGPRRWTGVCIGLIGAIIVIRPGLSVFQPAALLPIVSAVCFAGYSIATRHLGSEEHPATSFFYTALFGGICATLVVPFFWVTPTFEDAAIMSIFGVLGGMGHYLLILALGFTTASIIAPFSYASLVLNTAWALIFFSEFPDLWTVIGALVIVSAGIYVWHRERQAARRAA